MSLVGLFRVLPLDDAEGGTLGYGFVTTGIYDALLQIGHDIVDKIPDLLLGPGVLPAAVNDHTAIT